MSQLDCDIKAHDHLAATVVLPYVSALCLTSPAAFYYSWQKQSTMRWNCGQWWSVLFSICSQFYFQHVANFNLFSTKQSVDTVTLHPKTKDAMTFPLRLALLTTTDLCEFRSLYLASTHDDLA
jgi:hypothetical protein